MPRYSWERSPRHPTIVLIFDGLRGHVDSAAIATCIDDTTAEKIVDALNLHDAHRATTDALINNGR